MPRRARPEDPRLVALQERLRKSVGSLVAEIREEIRPKMQHAELAEAIAKIGGRYYGARGKKISDLEAGRFPVALEDIVMLARALSTRTKYVIHPLQLTPWMGLADEKLWQPYQRTVSPTPEAIEAIEQRLRRQLIERRERKIDETARAFEDLLDDPTFKQAIADLADMSQRDREVMQRALRGLARPELPADALARSARPQPVKASGMAGYRAAAEAATKRGQPFKPVNQRATKASKGGSRKR